MLVHVFHINQSEKWSGIFIGKFSRHMMLKRLGESLVCGQLTMLFLYIWGQILFQTVFSRFTQQITLEGKDSVSVRKIISFVSLLIKILYLSRAKVGQVCMQLPYKSGFFLTQGFLRCEMNTLYVQLLPGSISAPCLLLSEES